MSPFTFLSSTALMLLEPMSRPTIDFADPNPNIFASLLAGRSSGCARLFLGAFGFPDRALLLHPLIQDGFLEFPAIAQLKGRDLLFVNVLVERVGTYAQVLRSLADVHHFTRICAHRCLALSRKYFPLGFTQAVRSPLVFGELRELPLGRGLERKNPLLSRGET